MDRYWKVLRDNWLLFLLGFALTTAVAVYYTLGLPDRYESSGTFVVRPREGIEGVAAFDALNRGVEISSTYAYIARSNQIQEQAKASLELPTRGLSVSARVVTGTNILEVSVSGRDPVAVHALASAVGVETVTYVENLGDAFVIAPLDSPEVPNSPAGPNRALTIALGAVLGVAVGSLTALLGHLTREWLPLPSRAGMMDPSTKVYSRKYFNARFRKQIAEAERHRRTISVGLIRVVADHETHDAVPTQVVLRQVAFLLEAEVTEADLLAYLDDGVFAMLMPDRDASFAEHQVKQWRKEIESSKFSDADGPVTLRVVADVSTYGYNSDGSLPGRLAELFSPS